MMMMMMTRKKGISYIRRWNISSAYNIVRKFCLKVNLKINLFVTPCVFRVQYLRRPGGRLSARNKIKKLQTARKKVLGTKCAMISAPSTFLHSCFHLAPTIFRLSIKKLHVQFLDSLFFELWYKVHFNDLFKSFITTRFFIGRSAKYT